MERVDKYLSDMFKKLPRNKETNRLKANLYETSEDKYDDLIQSGMDQYHAEEIIINQIGDVEEFQNLMYINSQHKRNVFLIILICSYIVCKISFISISFLPTRAPYYGLMFAKTYLLEPLTYLLLGSILVSALWRLKAFRNCSIPRVFKVLCVIFSFLILAFSIYCWPSVDGTHIPILSDFLASLQYVFIRFPHIFSISGVLFYFGLHK